MRRIISFLFLVGISAVAQTVFAVWSPSTSIEKEESHTQERQLSPRVDQVIQKLEEEADRLARVLSNLERDEARLKDLVERKDTTNPASPKKENQDGHRLH
ncbi:MAG: hypothetical protein KCHDKBKB_00281 [Elusimicrobia bacterium]|nr:hypothetical protein [Elusimicrobiota bacterium]